MSNKGLNIKRYGTPYDKLIFMHALYVYIVCIHCMYKYSYISFLLLIFITSSKTIVTVANQSTPLP